MGDHLSRVGAKKERKKERKKEKKEDLFGPIHTYSRGRLIEALR